MRELEGAISRSSNTHQRGNCKQQTDVDYGTVKSEQTQKVCCLAFVAYSLQIAGTLQRWA